MRITDLIKHLNGLGIYPFVEGGKLKTRSESAHVDPQAALLIRTYKDALIEFFSADSGLGAASGETIAPREDRDAPAPLSFAQQRLWFLDQLGEAASAAYHVPAALRLSGRLNVEALKATLDRVVARHESLRTRVVTRDGAPCQLVAPAEVGFALAEHDLGGFDGDARDSEVARIGAEEARAPFDLALGPLIRGRLLRLAEHEHVLLVTQHHIVSDGWSIQVLVREISALYAAFVEGRPDPLPALPIQYPDYAAWQRRHLAGDALQAQTEFWREHLLGAPALLELPLDRPRPPVQSYAGDRVGVRLSADTSAALRRLSHLHGTTLFMTVLAVWSLLLSRLSGQDEVVVGTPVANRQRPEIEPLMGLFANTLALRVRLHGEPDVAALLAQVKATTLAAYSNQDLPFEQLVEALRPTRSLSHNPVFQTLLTVNNAARGEGLRLPGLELAAIDNAQQTTQFDLALSLTDGAEGMVGHLAYATDLFDRASVERIGECWATLMQAFADGEGHSVARLPLMPPAQREQVVERFNATAAEYPTRLTVHGLFEAQAARTPEAIAVQFEGASLSYDALNRRANRLAYRLLALGVRPDDRVAICVERSLEMVVGLLAILKAGAAYVPLDPDYPAERLGFLLGDCAPSALLTQARLRAALPALAAVQAPVFVLDEADEPAAGGDERDRLNPDPYALGLGPRNLAYVIYTSGSTGLPKGAMNQHDGVVNRLLWAQSRFALRGGDAVLQKTSFSFDVSVWEFFLPLLAGARLVLAAPGGHQDLAYLARTIEDAGITVVHFVPSMLQMFLAQRAVSRCAGLRHVLCSGEALPFALQQRFFDALPGVALHNLYGPTEAAVDVTYWRCERDDARGLVPIGHPIANTRMYILDALGQPVPVGVSGEIHIGGVQVARGYWNREALSAERFVADPFCADPEARLYRTGDLGRWLPDGAIDYLGRNDFQVKIRGFRIELGEIESRLAACEGVRETVVVAREDERGDQRLVAYATLHDGAQADVPAWRAQLSAHLPEHMLPNAFVVLDAFPLSANGKLERKALPAPDHSAVLAREYEAPRGEIEQAIAEVWQELLNLEQVGRHDRFFELGGHSLLVIGMIERLRQRGLETDVRTVFVATTLSDLAERIGAHRIAPAAAIPANPITPATVAITPELLPLATLTQDEIDGIVASVPGGVGNIQDIYPLAPLQQGILFHHLLDSDGGDAYLLRSMLAFDTRERLDAFLGALQAVIDRHDILRTAVRWQGLLKPVQVVHRQAPLSLEVIEVEAGASALERLRERTDPRRIRLDLRRAPLLAAVAAFDAEQGEWLLALLNHHITDDNYTVQLLLKEVQWLLVGQAERLPAPTPYRNFVAQAGAVSEAEHEAYFRERLGDFEEPTAPFGVLDVHGGSERVRETRRSLDAALGRRLREVARQHGVTPAVLFHVAWAQVLARCSGRDDVVFGTVLSGRLQGNEGAEHMVGMFINTLPIRLPTARASVAEAVADTYRRLGELLTHEQASLALAQRCSAVPSPLPLFTALLNYRHTHEADSDELAAAHQAWAGIRMLGSEERTNYPITLSVGDWGQGFTLTSQCAAGIDPLRVSQYLETALHSLAAALAERPALPLSQLEVLGEAERGQVLADFNDTRVDYPREACIQQVFEAQAARRADAVAVEHDGVALTYAQLNERANQVAHRLLALGVRPDDRVGLCAERGIELIVGMLGILKAGGAYVPLDPGYPDERLGFLLRDSAPKALLGSGEALSRMRGLSELPGFALDDPARFADQPSHNPDAAALGLGSRNLAYVIYTSGSTGEPKGVMVEHRNVLRLAVNNHFAPLGDEDCVAHCANPAFDASTWEVWGALLSGARVLAIAPSVVLDPAQLNAALIEGKVTALWLTVGLFNEYAEALAPAFARLDHLLIGGDALDPRSVARALSREQRPRRLVNGYGPTETTTFAITHEIALADTEGLSIPIGRPIANTSIYLLDAHGQPVPVGVSGEIHIGGDGVARGYLNQPALTEERFIADPHGEEAGARLYKTGDLGRWRADGTIEYLGRNDFQVKIRGFRIELGEIESRLAACEGVRETVVLARADDGGDKRLVAYLIAQDGHELSVSDLRAQLAGQLPDYMLPSAFVVLDAMPLTANGKLDRKALPAPDHSAVLAREYEAPRGEIEQAIAEVWQELLNLEQVGRHDRFFELGGHSLLVIGMIERLRQHGLETDVRTVFAATTLSDLAERIGAHRIAPAAAIPANPITPATVAITPELLPLATLTQDEIDGIVASVPGGVGNIQDIYPLAPLQEGILFHHLLDSDAGDAYLLRSILAFDTRERLDAFLGALQAVIDRHDILRTAVRWQGLSKPMQVVHRAAPLQVVEFSGAVDETDTALTQLLRRTDPRRVRLDLQVAPLLAAHTVFDPATGEWLLALLNHHLVCDHITLGLILDDIQCLLLDRPDQLPPTTPYRNFVARTGEVAESSHEAYFREQLGDVEEPTTPFGVLDVHGGSERVREAQRVLDADLNRRVRESARKHVVTPAVLFHVAWAQVLARCSGRDDVVFGTVLSGRLQGSDGAERMVGMFINTLPIRLPVARVSVAEAVADTYRRLGDLLTHEQASLALAQRCSGVQPPLPLFTALLNYRHSEQADADQAAAAERAWTGVRVLGTEERTNYPLTMSVGDWGNGFTLTTQCTGGIDPERIARLLETTLRAVLDALATEPQQPLSEIAILDAGERQQVLADFNDTRVDYPREACIQQVFESQAARRADAVAVEHDGAALTYAQLNERANQVAHRLLALGVRPDDRVGLCAERGIELIVGMLGILKAGSAYVPLDPGYPDERLGFLLRDSAPKALLGSGEALGRMRALSDLPGFALDDPAGFADQPSHNPDAAALGLGSRNLAYVIYTSGSTGEPKGVMVEHRNVLGLAVNNHFAPLGDEDCVAHCANPAFDASTWEVWGALLNGARVLAIAPSVVLDPARLNTALIEGKVTALWLTVGLFNEYADALAPAFARLDHLLIGGDALDPRSVARALAREQRPRRLVNGYGPTETTTFAITHEIALADTEGLSIPIGRPIANTSIYLLDAHGQPVPVGVSGEIHIGGDGVARGYLNQPALTEECFIADPYGEEAGARLYKTGDLGRWRADGTIEYLGRNDFQVKIRGFRIELGEIESRLAACEGVRETVVLARADDGGDKRLVAYLIAEEGRELSVSDLRAQLAGQLPDYMLPSAFVVLDAMPLTANGKLDRKALPVPELASALEHVEPSTDTERRLAAIWREILKLERISVHSGFFELGGHSLLATRVVSAVLLEFSCTLKIKDLFAHQTVFELAQWIDALQAHAPGGPDQDPVSSQSDETLEEMEW